MPAAIAKGTGSWTPARPQGAFGMAKFLTVGGTLKMALVYAASAARLM